jgi:hypothetical protein
LKGPLVGIKEVPLVSLKVAIGALRGGPHNKLFESLKGIVLTAALAKVAPILEGGKYPTMTLDEAATIYLYTMETLLYGTLNDALSSEDAIAIAPFKPYIKLFLTALYKLPIEKHTVYRGRNIDKISDYKEDKVLIWWTFSSSSRRDGVAHSFAEKKKEKGLSAKFIIENVPCVNIEGLSDYPGEYERLLLPCTSLKVLSVTKIPLNDDRWDIQAEFIKGQAVFDFMHPEWPIDLFGAPKK